MRNIDEILIENQLSPTLLSKEEKKQFGDFWAQAKNGDTTEFLRVARDAQNAVLQIKQSLSELTETLMASLDAVIARIDPMLGDACSDTVLFSSASSAVLTKRHMQLVTYIDEQNRRLADCSETAIRLRRTAEVQLLSPAFATRALLCHAALREQRADGKLVAFFASIIDIPEQTEQLLCRTEALLSNVCDAFSDFTVATSRAITDVNKNGAPQTTYRHLLRDEQIKLHDMKETVNGIRNEVQHVKIPDVL